MKRAAIYARFSSEKQNDRSCQDQIDICRAWAERDGMLVVADYRDEAISGASTVNRLGLGRLMRDAREDAFDVVVCEALDRLSRDQADLAGIRKSLNFLEIGISTIADGEVGAIHIGLKGLMGELFLADLAQKTRRGQRARVQEGGIGGGSSYGYASVPGQTGAYAIIEDEAAVIRRIFTEYAAGKTPREIVFALNREGIPGPRGGTWSPSTINGSRERANGILRNRLYAGEIVWNRQRFIKDPATGKRVSRPNPQSEWIIAPAPHLAIVDPELFAKVNATQTGKGQKRPAYARKPKHLFSGLVKCGCCSGGFAVQERGRMGCNSARERGTCDNRVRVGRDELETRVLTAVGKRLLDPALVETYVREYHASRKALAAANRSASGGKRKRLAELLRTIDRMTDMLISGEMPAAISPKIIEMEREAAGLKLDLASLDAEESVVVVHPRAATKYRAIAEDFRAHVAAMKAGEVSTEAVLSKARAFIDRIEVAPGKKKDPATITVYGVLAGLLEVPSSNTMHGIVGCGSPQQPIPCIKIRA